MKEKSLGRVIALQEECQSDSGAEREVNSLRGPVLVAFLGAMALLGLYVGVLTLAKSLAHALDQFVIMWPWFSALTLGFGVQMGLYAYTRKLHKIRHPSHGTSARGLTATGGMSTAAMAACCVHHLSDVLPVLGLTGAALFFSDYQKVFLLGGILSNIAGITLMLYMMQKHGLMDIGHPLFERISRWDIGKLFKWNIGLSIAVLTVFVAARVWGQYS
jgi:hypothetical protein